MRGKTGLPNSLQQQRVAALVRHEAPLGAPLLPQSLVAENHVVGVDACLGHILQPVLHNHLCSTLQIGTHQQQKTIGLEHPPPILQGWLRWIRVQVFDSTQGKHRIHRGRDHCLQIVHRCHDT